jgi:hypothetical protein
MRHRPDTRRLLLGHLFRAADELQGQVNQFIGLAIMAEVEVPDVLYETNAELVRLLVTLRGRSDEPQAVQQSPHTTVASLRRGR